MKNAEAESKDAQSHAGAKVEGRMMNEEMPVKGFCKAICVSDICFGFCLL
jgi:hypothetical protein